MAALDLRTGIPRSPFDELEGFPWLPRLIDKTRAFYAGTHGDYSPYPCMGDNRFLTHFGLDAEALGQVIKSGATDAEVVSWVRNHTQTDPAAYRAEMRGAPGNALMRLAVWIFRTRLQRKLGASRPDVNWSNIDTFPKLLAVEEGHGLP